MRRHLELENSNKKKRRYNGVFKETNKASDYENLDFTVILVQPESVGNIGSIARLMENFNFSKLVIFNPIETTEKIRSYYTQGFAMHGKNILMNAEIIEINNQSNNITEFQSLIQNYDFVIATTAKGKNYSNIRRLSIFPEDFTLPLSLKPLKIAILFGRESRGLTNEVISKADLLIRIPTHDKYPALNLSHACGIVLYEIFKKLNIINIGRGKNPVLIADKKDRLILFDIIQNIIEKLNIASYKKDNVYFAFRNIFGRKFMSKKELSLVLGVFSKLNNILEGLNLY